MRVLIFPDRNRVRYICFILPEKKKLHYLRDIDLETWSDVSNSNYCNRQKKLDIIIRDNNTTKGSRSAPRRSEAGNIKRGTSRFHFSRFLLLLRLHIGEVM